MTNIKINIIKNGVIIESIDAASMDSARSKAQKILQKYCILQSDTVCLKDYNKFCILDSFLNEKEFYASVVYTRNKTEKKYRKKVKRTGILYG